MSRKRKTNHKRVKRGPVYAPLNNQEGLALLQEWQSLGNSKGAETDRRVQLCFALCDMPVANAEIQRDLYLETASGFFIGKLFDQLAKLSNDQLRELLVQRYQYEVEIKKSDFTDVP